jgi:tryptophan 2,3-dioxygenase
VSQGTQTEPLPERSIGNKQREYLIKKMDLLGQKLVLQDHLISTDIKELRSKIEQIGFQITQLKEQEDVFKSKSKMILKFYSNQMDNMYELKNKISNKISNENFLLKVLRAQTNDFLEFQNCHFQNVQRNFNSDYFDLTALVKDVFSCLSIQATYKMIELKACLDTHKNINRIL